METTPNNTKTGISPGIAALVLIILALIAVAFAMLPLSTPQESQTAAVPVVGPFTRLVLGAKATIVVDMRSGKTLYEKNADVQLPLASLTKVALALSISEVLNPNSVITIPRYTSGANGEHLLQGERWRVRDLLDFTLVTSSNDGAEILAALANDALHERYPDSPEDGATIWRMNELVKDLGLKQTFFLNASGLDLSETQAGAYGSARDMAALFAYAASAYPSLFSGTARGGLLLTSEDGLATKTAQNTNSTQGTIPGLIMGKTGFTDLAGGNLAVVFDVGLAHPVVALVLGSTYEGRFDDIQKLVSTTHTVLTEAE